MAIGSQNAEIGDVVIPFEPSNPSVYALLAKYIEEKDPKEIIIEGKGKVVGQLKHKTGDTILHFEDGSYDEMNVEDVYNHINQEYKCEDIEELTSLKYSEDSGKLCVIVRWKMVGRHPWMQAC
jgi:hypothetical protein